MELVYLWVEEYKNIKQQGFNFSPRFTCSYEDDELTIIDKKETKEPYLKNFFGNNVNVTAIVGENGSGKSSIFKIIIYLFAIYFGERISKVDADGKYILVIKTDNGFRLLKNNFQNITCNENLEKLTKREMDFYSIYVNYMMDSLKDGPQEDWVDELYYRNDNYKTPILLEPNKKNNKIELDSLDYISEQRFDWQFLVGEKNEVIQSFFNPDVVVVNIGKKLISKLKRLDKASFDNPMLKYMTDQHAFLKDKTYNDLDSIFKQHIDNLEQEVGMLLQNKAYTKINKIYFALKILSSGLVGVSIFEELVKVVESDELLSELIAVVERRGLDTIYEEDIKHCERLTFATKDKLLYCVEFNKIENKISSKDLRNCKLKLENKKDYAEKLRSYPMWITKTYYEGNNPPSGKTLAKLSSGEKTYLKFLMMLVYEIEQIKTGTENPYTTINFFLDEIELSMHPNWQKRLLSDIVAIFEKSKIKINLMMASHSPFILSDLPKENVIFLEKGEQVEVNINPFGANIHTLLSHGFFMKDGLMGEFAKSKIEDVINYLNDKKSTIRNNDDAQKLLNIMGEPIIKNQLQRMLDSKRLSKVDEIDKIKLDMETLAKRLAELEK